MRTERPQNDITIAHKGTEFTNVCCLNHNPTSRTSTHITNISNLTISNKISLPEYSFFPLTITEVQVMHSTTKVAVLNIIIFIPAHTGACLTTIEEAQMSTTRRGHKLR